MNSQQQTGATSAVSTLEKYYALTKSFVADTAQAQSFLIPMNLVIIPFHDWKKCEHEGFRTRDAHFMEEFGRHPQVEKLLVIDRPTSLAETLLLGKNWSVLHGTAVASASGRRISQVGDKTFTCDIRVPDLIQPLLLRRKWIPQAYGMPRVVAGVRDALETLGMAQSFALFISAPLFVPLVKHLSPQVFAFDAQDNLLKSSLYKDMPHLSAYYDFCIRTADVISANSAETTRWLSQQRSDPQHIANGVSPEVFDPQKQYATPADLTAIARPRVGYAGKMQEMFDVKLMCGMAESLPAENFVFIGQQLNRQWMKPLWRYPNVFYLGDKQYDLLPSYIASFDICMIPYRPEAQHGGDPIKFYEYLAMGKPIVTTDIGGVGEFRQYPQVCIADSPAQFKAGLEYFLQKLRGHDAIATKALPKEVFWRTKADTIVQKIAHIVGSREGDSHFLK